MKHKLSHIDESGKATMVDISDKDVTSRVAIASGKISFPSEVFKILKTQDFLSKKGS
jgi:cyclic pyranopterin phosphate synthase